jgi:nitrate/TMAO reductase-like tetraheme cytochrome c subunit
MNLNKIISLFVLSIFFGTYANAQISPGELCKAHEHLEGASNCTQCHAFANKVTREKCLDCHKEIQANINANKGYHASSEVKGKNCAACHNDHHGKNFQVIKFNKKTFDHAKAGFVLKGKHAKQECKACHKPEFIKDPKYKKKLTTYLGLSQTCLSCHDDYHQGKLSSKCTECHSFDSWKNAERFDHSKTKFPLLGKHIKVACVDCHKVEIINGKKAQKFTGLNFTNCTPCHKDVHDNKFGQNCKKCHTEESFHFNKSMKAFDHDKTDFKLVGKHKLVDCKQCHKGELTAPIKHNQCQSCHKDYHNGDFTKKGVTPDCDQCHTNDGFIPSTFTIEKHNKTKFKLEDAHLASSCMACHKKDNKNWSFKNMGTKCVDCHKNEHKGFIQEKFYPNEECIACHNAKNWKEIKFDHNKTGFKLEGEHAKTACGECHYGKNELGVRTQKFQNLSQECSSCHKDSHVGQFEVNGKTDCTRCHGFDKWENSKYDHNTSRFKIDGKHIGVKCEECHKPVMNEKGKYIEYKFDDISCARCHK